MSTINEQKIRQANERFRSSMNRSAEIMEPYIDILDTDEGMMAMLLVAASSLCVAAGLDDPRTLNKTIQQASLISGFPVDGLNAYSDAMVAMYALGSDDGGNIGGERHV